MKQEKGDRQNRISFPVQLFGEGSSFAEAPEEIHVVPTGQWSHPVYGEMEITPAHIAEFAKNFKDKVRLSLPITQGHDNGMSGGELPAIGWFKELLDKGMKGLYAVVEWTEEGKKLLSSKSFKYFSPEFYEQYTDPESGEKYSHVLVGGALTNKPYFKVLQPVVQFSEKEVIINFVQPEPMDLKTIVSKKVEELNADEKSFLKTHKEELNAEQLSAFKSVFDEPAPKKDGEDDDKKDKIIANEPKPGEGKVITMSETEANKLREDAQKGVQAFSELEKMKLGQEVDKLCFSGINKTGILLPTQKNAVVELMFSLNDKQRDQLRDIFGKMPKRDNKLFTEIGDGGDAGGTDAKSFAEKIDKAVKDIIKANPKLSYGKAQEQLFTEQPELKQQYDASLNGKN